MADRETARRALEEHSAALRRLPGVVGVGLQAEGDGPGEALAVYLDGPAHAREMPKSVSVRGGDGVEEVPVRVIQVGGGFKAE